MNPPTNPFTCRFLNSSVLDTDFSWTHLRFPVSTKSLLENGYPWYLLMKPSLKLMNIHLNLTPVPNWGTTKIMPNDPENIPTMNLNHNQTIRWTKIRTTLDSLLCQHQPLLRRATMIKPWTSVLHPTLTSPGAPSPGIHLIYHQELYDLRLHKHFQP